MQKQKIKTNFESPRETSEKSEIQIGTKVNYVAAESNPEASYFFFAYKVKITNHGKVPAQLMSRHWVITDGTGHVEEVRGAGVVGAQPRIMPNQSFEYESACPLSTASGSMKGHYQMQTEEGDIFEVAIPEFYMIAPSALH